MGKYVSYIDDDKLMECIEELFEVYQKTVASFDLKKFYKNMIDPFKMQFDVAFLYGDNVENWVNDEMRRKLDKTVNNAIGEFHQKLIGCLPGLESAYLADYDVKSKDDDSLFAEVKNKYNTMNSRSQDAVFEALSGIARNHRNAKCYLVEVVSPESIMKVWEYSSHGQVKKHERVYITSADQFYAMVVGQDDAFKELCDNLPRAISDFLDNKKMLSNNLEADKVVGALEKKASAYGVDSISEVLFKDMFEKYKGFE